mgnify:CR=1 FL=1
MCFLIVSDSMGLFLDRNVILTACNKYFDLLDSKKEGFLCSNTKQERNAGMYVSSPICSWISPIVLKQVDVITDTFNPNVISCRRFDASSLILFM